MSNMIKVIDLAHEFDLSIQGDERKEIIAPGNLKTQKDNHIYWLKHPQYAESFPCGILIVNKQHFEQIQTKSNICYLITDSSARLIFAKVVNKHFSNLGLQITANQAAKHRLNSDIIIADNVFISENVEIGSGTTIYPNVVIHNNTFIGPNCTIKSNCTIGTEGLGYEKENNQWIKFPQIGGVIIESDVVMGPSVTIRRGALDNTIIRSGVKIGSFSNIGHNCIIGKNSILTCQCVTGGSTILGEDVYMGINSITRNGIKVGHNAIIGAGAIVVKNVTQNTTVIGNPAVRIEEFKKWTKTKRKFMNDNSSIENSDE